MPKHPQAPLYTIQVRTTLLQHLLVIGLRCCIAVSALWAAPPDLTKGEQPTNEVTINLGPTGMRGWIYHTVRGGPSTQESRQILITSIDTDSPADGVLSVGDVILGASGNESIPSPFQADARRSFALAIAEAEASRPARLRLLRWRDETVSTVDIPLQHLGAYASTAPYHCNKSAQILSQGLQYLFNNRIQRINHRSNWRDTFNAITMLLSSDQEHQDKLREIVRALVPDEATRRQMMSDERDATRMVTWERGYTLVLMAEYYLATGDEYVLPGIEAYAVNIAKNQSHFGTLGHIYADRNPDGSPGPMGGVYGAVNQTALTCFQGLVLAKACGLTNPEIADAIERTSIFFGSFAEKSCIPYGEHAPTGQSHENNGTSGQAALALARVPNRTNEARFFAKMATASASEREIGHTGAWWNFMWAPLGAAAGGEGAAIAHFKDIAWHLDLARTWQGGFMYDNLNGEGPTGGPNYHGLEMATPALLLYGLPLRRLHIAGANPNPKMTLNRQDVLEAQQAAQYDPDNRHIRELFQDLGSWSPKVRGAAAKAISEREVTDNIIAYLHDIARDSSRPRALRAGACHTLGYIKHDSSVYVLAELLTDADSFVRFRASEALRLFPDALRLLVVDQALHAAAAMAQPTFPAPSDDPLQFAHGSLGTLLFYAGRAYGPRGILQNQGITGIDRDLLYPAIRAIARTPVGFHRSCLTHIFSEHLTEEDVKALADAIIEAIVNRSPSDRMFSNGIRQHGVTTLYKYGFAEGVPACMQFLADEVGGRRRWPIDKLGKFGPAVRHITPDPDVVAFLQPYVADNETSPNARQAIDSIRGDAEPMMLVPLKSIESVRAEETELDTSDPSTRLLVRALDHARGDASFTWRQLEGPGNAQFTLDGPVRFGQDHVTSASVTRVDLPAIAGTYILEVIMSDSRGFTEVSDTVTLTVK